MLLFLVFFPREQEGDQTQDRDQDQDQDQDTALPTWKEAVVVLALSVAFFAFALLGSVVFAYAAPSHIRGWANFLGLLATALAAVQYLPQISTTWRLQETGSLSVAMMAIQTPGSFVFAASLAARLGPAGWSAWGLFIFTGLLQGALLAMSLWFMWRDRQAAKSSRAPVANGHGDDDNDNDNDEQTPLVGNRGRRDRLG